jgi:hypothetical protein
VEPATVTVSALKPRGNPLAAGRTRALTDTASEDATITVRLRETSGRATTARVRLGSGAGTVSAWLTDLLEESDGAPLPVEDGTVIVDMPAFGTVNVLVSTSRGGSASRGDDPPGPPRSWGEPSPQTPLGGDKSPQTVLAPLAVEPIYARYWLHGKGPAPVGNLPVAVHFSPVRVALAEPGETVALRLTVGCGAEPASGVVELITPAEVIVAAEADLRYQLAPGGYAAWDLAVRVPPGTAAGRYFVAARIRDDLGHLVEDTAMVAVGERRWPDPDLPPEETLELMQADYRATAAEVDVAVLTPELRLAPGGQGELLVRVTSGLASELHGEAQLVSPFGTWEMLGPPAQGFSIAPETSTVLRFVASVPVTARHAQWWALVKVMYYGRVRYTEAIPVVIEPVN